MNAHKELDLFFKERPHFAKAKEFLRFGFTHHDLLNLLAKQELVRVKRGLYQWNSGEYYSDWAETIQIVPKGIFGMFTSASFYGLTTLIPSEHHVVIPKHNKVKLPKYPPIQLYYWTETSYNLGVQEVEVEGCKVRMFDKEKTVCDMIRLRHKVGFETMKEVLKNYLRLPDRNITKLQEYSHFLHIKGVLVNYLEILL